VAPVRNVSDTARWVAYFRARETERPDGLFHDPLAARLAGERGFEIANTLPEGNKHEWAWVARTYLFDRFLDREIEQGADLVLNLAAGLDARPYRMQLPSTLRWVEVDFPEIISYKNGILDGETPRCNLRRIALDLSDLDARRHLFAELDGQAKRIVVLTEGLLIYFTSEAVGLLAGDLADAATFQSWIVDLASPTEIDAANHRQATERGERGFSLRATGRPEVLPALRMGAGGSSGPVEDRGPAQARASRTSVAIAGAKGTVGKLPLDRSLFAPQILVACVETGSLTVAAL